MKNYTDLNGVSVSNRASGNKRNVVAVIILIILPLVLGGLFVVQKFRSSAEVITQPEQFHAERLSATSARIEFQTAQQAKITVFCAVSIKGVKFYCGEDEDPVVKHSISTADFKVNLNTGQGYYVFTNIPQITGPIGYIPADKDNPTFGLDSNIYGEDNLGLCLGDENFDPKLDVNQDGCVYTNDLVQLY